ncbi:MAG: Peptide methionine sulfoxide reductase MsrA [Moraxellaceae bacterium]|jgi:peptide-methionine (S)-S-oxide reductase|nr:Peptide methionine sulfoxide reductase MsrA [Moraxellaceae bacterium]
MSIEKAVLGGGCFWCLDAVFREVQGVTRVVSGYAGGARANPSYEQICSGATGHAEVVEVSFENTALPFRELLAIFFAIHDPTTKDRQGHDIGTQYRSVIFCQDAEQETVARDVIRELDASRVFGSAIVTEIVAAPVPFWPAEDYHQNYFALNPGQGYCQIVVAPKLAKFRQKFASQRTT